MLDVRPFESEFSVAKTLDPAGAPPLGLERLGQGRSAVVYRRRTPSGSIVHKLFGGDWPGRLVMHVLTGAPNPYRWSLDAVRCALLRRKICRVLLRYWFGTRISTPRALGIAWRRPSQAFSLQLEFINGRHVPLRHAARQSAPDPLPDLLKNVMRPLQQRLIEVGFDGLVWQAGLGNPVATGNFMLQGSSSDRWVWVDLESGVPAIFPLNPLSLLKYYLPQALRRRRLLFDDVDTERLQEYLTRHSADVDAQLGPGTSGRLDRLASRLAQHQQRWKSLTRAGRGIAYYRSRNRITPNEALWYERHPFRWHLRLLCDAMQSAAAGAARWGKALIVGLFGPAVIRWLQAGMRFLFSQRFREHCSQRYVHSRLRSWRRRRFLSRRLTAAIWRETKNDDSNHCLADVVVHTACKVPTKVLQMGAVPLLLAAGVLNVPTAALILVAGGALIRTAYTLLRCGQSLVRRRRVPWLALFTGLLPVIGTSAFAVQFIYWSGRSRDRLPQFLLFDICAGIGRNVPVWGGADSLLESLANRAARILFSMRSSSHD